MDYTGLGVIGTRYKLNRPLTDDERASQLKQKDRLDVPLLSALCVIRMNSIYLESVDRYYAWRGVLTTFMATLFGMFGGAYVAIAYSVFAQFSEYDIANKQGSLGFLGFTSLLIMPFLWFVGRILLYELFTYTHFPIRLNRKTRKVYVFRPGRPNRPILVANWDKLFFTLSRCNRGLSEARPFLDIRGHVLADDGSTVLDTFAFSPFSMQADQLQRHWEFLRRYMEDGPADSYAAEKHCLPIADRRESFRWSFNRFHLNFQGANWFWVAFLPIWLLSIGGRWLAARTCKVPVWPQEIETECEFDPCDPYVRDARMNPSDIWLV